MYRDELASKDPMHSVLDANPEILLRAAKTALVSGVNGNFKPGSYYDTTVGSKHPFWRNKDLPIATKDIRRLRAEHAQLGVLQN